MNQIKVLVVDDSALVRKMLTEILEGDPQISVVGTAVDPYVAREKIKELSPDVITLDIEMPRMDGISFLERLMRLRPMPVVMVSTLTQRGADVALRALELGAVDFVPKPGDGVDGGLVGYSEEIIRKVKNAARINLNAFLLHRNRRSEQHDGLDREHRSEVSKLENPERAAKYVLAIGASTGGTEAVRDMLVQMPAASPAILIAQHIPAVFSGAFAKRLNDVSPMTVVEAKNKQPVLPGYAYVAPGGQHLVLAKASSGYRCELSDTARVNRHRPSVDVLFDSVAKIVGEYAIGVILTGMGVDGAKGMASIAHAGGITIAQDQQSSVVWGMPGEAVKLGAARHVLPINQIGTKVVSLVNDRCGDQIGA